MKKYEIIYEVVEQCRVEVDAENEALAYVKTFSEWLKTEI